MRITFWGTRGSLAKPGPSTIKYGGNTSCVQIESDSGELVVLDCGTGAHGLGQDLLARGEPVRGSILISHTHWDHIQGLPFFTPLFIPGNEWDVYGPRGFGDGLRDTLSGQMQYTYFPVTLDALGAEVRYHNLVEGVFELDGIRVRTRYLNHPALTLGYRLEVDGVTVVYACDHEPHARELATEEGEPHGQDLEHADFLRSADLVIHDAQYTAEEYPSKIGWGHGTPDYAVRLCASVGVKRLALSHHEPMHDDAMLDSIAEAALALVPDGAELEVFAAAEGQVLELTAEPGAAEEVSGGMAEALSAAAASDDIEILMGMPESPEAALILAAAEADDLDVARTADPAEAAGRFEVTDPAMVIVEGTDAGLEAVRAIRAQEEATEDDVPVILVGPEAKPHEAVTDWLVTPFSQEYARSRIRAWLLRVEHRWIRAGLPDEESDRLATLRGLELLDTAPEQRFDRITRLASALFQVPSAWVTLMDAERQWFKSRVGVEEEETPRDVSFCSHTILQSEPLVVEDAHQDPRFADSPLVTGPPFVRFYAGCPLLVNGFKVGTLCISDVKPRQFSAEQVGLLRDLADLVEVELQS